MREARGEAAAAPADDSDKAGGASAGSLDDGDYRRLAAFRYLLRCFLEFSENAAAEAGLTPRQHQALLAIRGVDDGSSPTIGYLAERLRIRHHSAVELVDRLEESGLARREADPADRRRVKLRMTQAGAASLAQLSAAHMRELERMRPALLAILGQAGGAARRRSGVGDAGETQTGTRRS